MTLTLDFQGQIFQSCIAGVVLGPIDMEPNGCESIGSLTHFVTFDLTSPLTLTLAFQIESGNNTYI